MADGVCGGFQKYRVILDGHPAFDAPKVVQDYVGQRLQENFMGFIEHHINKRHPAEAEVVRDKLMRMITYLTVKQFQPLLTSEVENEDGSTTAGNSN